LRRLSANGRNGGMRRCSAPRLAPAHTTSGLFVFWLFRFFTLNVKGSAEPILTIRKIQKKQPASGICRSGHLLSLAFLSQLPLLIFTFGAYAFHCSYAEVQITTPARN
jgi:hypothetical protein